MSADVVIDAPLHARRLVVTKLDGMGDSPDWSIEVRGPGKICGVWFEVEESKTRGPDGKPLRAKLVPVIAFDCDPKLEIRHHEYCWCAVGMEISSPYRLTHVGTYITPAGPISLYEKAIPMEMQIVRPQSPVSGVVDGR